MPSPGRRRPARQTSARRRAPSRACCPEGGLHLVVGEHGCAREAGAHARELGLYPRHRRPEGSDRVAVVREAPFSPAPRPGRRADACRRRGSSRHPRRPDPARRATATASGKAPVDRAESRSGRARRGRRRGRLSRPFIEPEVEGVPDEGRHDLRPQAVDQLVERRPRREGCEESSVVDDVIGHVGEVVTRKVEELAAAEAARIDPVRDVRERSPVLAQLLRETAGVRLRARDVVGFDRHHELIETREIAGVLLVTLDEGLILRQRSRPEVTKPSWCTVYASAATAPSTPSSRVTSGRAHERRTTDRRARPVASDAVAPLTPGVGSRDFIARPSIPGVTDATRHGATRSPPRSIDGAAGGSRYGRRCRARTRCPRRPGRPRGSGTARS